MMRRPLLRFLIAIPVCWGVIALALAAGWLALGQPTAKGAVWFDVTAVGNAQYSGAPDKPFFFLALGNDGRSDADQGLGDAIHVIGVNPATRQATIINVPRDTTAPSGDKINSYHALQGLPGIVDQLNRMMGIDIGYAITTNFGGMVDMVNQIGGIDIVIPPIQSNQDSIGAGGDQTWNDSYTGANFTPGPQHIDGGQALAFSRDRHDFNLSGDIARTGNQAFLILSALATLRAKNPSDAATMILVATLAKHIRTHNIDLRGLWRLGRLALTLDPANIKSVTVPTGGGAGTNLALTGDAAGLFADFRDDAVLQTH
jgi:LCP family protein required for cell wall assembly